MIRKGDMKAGRLDRRLREPGTSTSGWNAGFAGRAQIGKGMWAMPDLMAAMLEQKIAPSQGRRQHRLGAVADGGDAARHCTTTRSTCTRVQAALQGPADGQARRHPVGARRWRARTGRRTRSSSELDNNAQGILGYVVRWIDQGVGCSKVPDIHDVGLMEDRATLRISAQHIANWLHHGVVHAGRR